MNQDFYLHIAKEAETVALQYFRGHFSIERKKDNSYVTEADVAVEKRIKEVILESYPDSVFLAEESNPLDGLMQLQAGSENLWIIDPIDGTSNFAHGLKYFCHSVGHYSLDNQRQLSPKGGVVHAPCLEETYVATAGGKAFLNGKPIFNNRQNQLSDAMLLTGFYGGNAAAFEEDLDRFRWVSTQTRDIRRYGAAALDMCKIAAGEFDAFWQRGLKPWDVAASAIILKEAGCGVYNFPFADQAKVPIQPQNQEKAGGSFDIFYETVVTGTEPAVEALLKGFSAL